MNLNPNRGWKEIVGSLKAHYFIDGRSLCKKWMNLGTDFENDNHNSPDNCKACMKARDAMEANNAVRK